MAHRPLSIALYSAFAGGVASFMLPATLAWANPQGQQVVRGSASFQANGNTLTVTNTPGAAINWQSFSIKANETTHFQQANSASSVLNRVVANNPSELLGNLTSNGKVVLINPFGITVGRGAAVDTAGFTASTLNITDADWANGKLRFKGNALSGDVKVDGVIRSPNGDVMLFAPNVSVGSEALIKADNGNVIIGAGQKVEVTGRGLEGIRFEIQSADNKAVNLGRIEGNAVGVFAGTLRHSGSITAQTAAMEGGKVVLRAIKDIEISGPGAVIKADGAAGKAGGQVSISSSTGDVLVGAGARITANGGAGAAGGTVSVAAELGKLVVEQASVVSANGSPAGSVRLFGATEARVAGVVTAASPVRTDSATQIEPISLALNQAVGGKVEVLGNEVKLLAGAQVDVSGDGGGGIILIGGDFQGANAAVPNAKNTEVAPGVTLTADGRAQGNGGRVIVWADNDTHFSGTISAKGGLFGGDGGFAETSGKKHLYYRGRTNLTAPRGTTGTLLLDPDEIIIMGGSQDGSDTGDSLAGTLNNGTGLGTVAGGTGAFTIYESEIEGTQANVYLMATNKISVGGTFTGGASGELTIQPGYNLRMQVTNATTGTHGIDLTTSGNGYGLSVRASYSTLTSQRGTISLETTSASSNGSVKVGSLVTDGGAVSIQAQGGVTIGQSGLGGIDTSSTTTLTGGGSVTILSKGAINVLSDIKTGTLSAIGGVIDLTAQTGLGNGDINIYGSLFTNGANVNATGWSVNTLSGSTTGQINAGLGGVSLVGSGNSIGSFSGGVSIGFGSSVKGSSVGISADRFYMHSSAVGLTGTSNVAIAPFSVSRDINIGGSDDLGTTFLGITQAENAKITTPLLRIGSISNTGNIDVSTSFLRPGDALSLITQGDIGQATLNPITASTLMVYGGSVQLLSKNLVTTFAGKATAAGLYYRSDGSFTVGAADFLTMTSAGTTGQLVLQADAGGGTITLASDVKTAGANIVFAVDRIQVGNASVNTVTIDSNSSTVGAGGNIQFLGDITAAQSGRKLLIDASMGGTGNAGGNISLNSITNIGGAYLNLLDVNGYSDAAVGTVSFPSGSATLSLGANGTGVVNQASLSIRNARMSVGNHVTLNTNAGGGTLTAGGLIDVSSSVVYGDANHRSLKLVADGGTNGDGGTIRLGIVTNLSDDYLGEVHASAVGNGTGAMGLLQLFGDISTTSSSSTIAPASGDVRLYGNVFLYNDVSIRTSYQTEASSAGSVFLGTSGGEISSAAAGRTLTVDTSGATTGINGGNVFLWEVGNTGGQYLSGLNINAAGDTNGVVYLNGANINLSAKGTLASDQATLSIQNAHLWVNANATLNTNTAGATLTAGGRLDLETARVGGTSTHATLVLKAHGGANGDGGNIRIGEVAAYSDWLGGLTASALGNGTGLIGSVELHGDIATTQSTLSPATGNVMLDGNVVLYSNVNIFTSTETFAPGAGSVLIGTLGGSVSAASKGYTLNINTSPANSGFSGTWAGNVSLPAFDDAGDSYLRGLLVTSRANTFGGDGAVRLNGSVLLDRGAALDGVEATLNINAGYLELSKPSSTLTIDTLQQTTGSGGRVVLNVDKINATSAGTVFSIDTSTPDNFASRHGGDIEIRGSISSDGAAAGFAPASVYVNATAVSPATNGEILLRGDILVADSGTISVNGSVVLGGSSGYWVLGSDSGTGSVDVTIAGSVDSDFFGEGLVGLDIYAGNAGVVDLSMATIGAGTPLEDLYIEANRVTLGPTQTRDAISIVAADYVNLMGDLLSRGGNISVTATAGTLGVHGNVRSIGYVGVADAGGNIALASTNSNVVIANTKEILSEGGAGADSDAPDDFAYNGGAGGTVSISGKSILIGNDVTIASRGGQGGDGLAGVGNGTSGGKGGNGGLISLTSTTGALTIGSSVTLGSYGGRGGHGANGAQGANGSNAFSSTVAGAGGAGYDGGSGGMGGSGGAVRISAPQLAVSGVVISLGGDGGNGGYGGDGGVGGAGYDDGFFVHASGDGGVGGYGQNGSSGGDGGLISLSAGALGSLSISTTSIVSQGGTGGIAGGDGLGGLPGTPMGSGGSGSMGGSPGGTYYSGADGGASTLSLSSSGGKGIVVTDSLLSGRRVELRATGGDGDDDVVLAGNSSIDSADGAYVSVAGGDLVMGKFATITVNHSDPDYNVLTLLSDQRVELGALSAPRIEVIAPVIESATGFTGVHLTGEVAFLGDSTIYSDVGTMLNPIKVELSGGLQVQANRNVWVESDADLYLSGVQTHVATGAGTIHIHSGDFLSASAGVVGNSGAGNVSVFLSGDGGLEVGASANVQASGTGTLQLLGGSGWVDIYGTAGSASGQTSISAGDIWVDSSGTVTSSTGQINLTADTIYLDGRLDSGSTGIAVVLVTDSFDMMGTIAAAGGTVALMPLTTGLDIAVGSTGFNAPPSTLKLIIEDSYFITANALQLGNADKSGGDVTFYNAYNPPVTRTLAVYGANITQNSGATLSLNGLMAYGTGAVELTRSGNNISTVAGRSGAGSDFRITSSNNLTVGTVAGVSGIDAGGGAANSAVGLASEGGSVSISGVSVRGTGGTLPVGVYIIANDLNIDAIGSIDAGGTGFAINPYSSNRLLDLGGSPGDGEFLLNAAELPRIQNYNAFYAGNSLGGKAFGNVEVGSAVSFGTAGLVIHATGAVTQGVNAITAGGLHVEAASVNLATAVNSLSTGHLGGEATSGDFAFKSSGTIKISDTGISASGDVSLHSTSGSIINSSSMGQQIESSGGNVSLVAATGIGESGGNGPLVVLASGQLTASIGSGDAWLTSDGDLALGAFSSSAGANSINVTTTGGAVNLTVSGPSSGDDNWNLQASGDIILDASGAIGAASATLTAGAGSILTNASTGTTAGVTGLLKLNAATIGSAANPIRFDAGTVSASVSSGGMYLLSVPAFDLADFTYTTPSAFTVSLASEGIISVGGYMFAGNDGASTFSLTSAAGIVFDGGTVTPGTVAGTGGILALSGPVSVLNDHVFQAKVLHTGSWSITGGAALQFNAGDNSLGSFSITDGSASFSSGSSSIGSLANAASGTLSLGGGNLSAGTVASQGGLIDLGSGGYTLTVAAGNLTNAGIITGAGTVHLTGAGGTLVNNSLITPGGDGAVGTISILGNLGQGASGRLKMDWAASGMNDHINVQGDFASGGTLSVGESAGVFLTGSEQFSAIYTQGTITGGVPAMESRTAGVVFAGNFTAGAAGHLMVSPASITNFWTQNTNAVENWGTGTNWSRGHAPTGTEDAVIAVGNNPQIDIASGFHGARSIDLQERLQVSSGAVLTVGTGDLNVGTGGTLALSGGQLDGAGDFNFNSGSTLSWTSGSMGGTGDAFVLAGGIANIGAGLARDLVRDFHNAGTFNSSAPLTFYSGVTLGNSGSMSLLGIGDNNFTGTGTVSNMVGGTITTAAGTSARIGTVFDNAGRVSASASDLWLQGGGSSTGTMAIASGRTLMLGGTAFTAGGSIVNNGGTLLLNADNAATITVGGGYSESVASTLSIAGASGNAYATFNGNLSTANLLQSNGVLDGPGNVTAGYFTRTGGVMTGTGTLQTNTLATMSGGGYIERTWNVNGALNLTGGYIDLVAGGTLGINAGAVLDLQSSFFDGGLLTITGAGTLINIGTLRNSYQNVDTGKHLAIAVGSLQNNGVIEFGAGANVRNLQIGGNSTHSSGATVNVAAGKQLMFRDGGTHSFAAGSLLDIATGGTLANSWGATVNVSGTFSSAGTLAAGNGTINFNTGSEVLLPALVLTGTIGGNDAITVTGAAQIDGIINAGTGAFTIGTGATATSGTGFTVISRTLHNDGTLNLTGGLLMLEGIMTFSNDGRFVQSGNSTVHDQFSDAGPATIANQSGGVYVFNSTELNGIEPYFQNGVGATLSVAGGRATFAGGGSQSGLIDLAAGTTLSTAGGTLVNASGAVIQGGGTLDASGAALINNGLLRPGGASAAGTLTVMGLLDMASGTVETELFGPASYDVVQVAGNLVKGGTLSVSEGAVFVAGGQSFDIVTFSGTLTGSTPAIVSSVTDVSFGLTAPGNLLRLSADSVTNRWAIDSGGAWNVAGNWSRGHAPNQLENVIIDRSLAAPVVTLGSAGAQAKSLVVVGDDTLLIAGASASLSIGVGGGNLSNLAMVGGTLAGGAIIHSGTADFSGNAQVQSGFTSTGTLNVSGTGVVFSGGGLLNAGTLNLAGGSGISFNAGSFNLLNATITASGDTFNITNNGHVTLSGTTALADVYLNIDGTAGAGGHLTLNNTGANTTGDFYMHGANALLDGSAALTVNGDFTWSGGTMAAGGTVTVSAGTDYSINTNTVSLLHRTLVNQNLLSIVGSNGLTLGTTGTIVNDAGATLYLTPDGSGVISTASGGRLINNGTVAFSGAFAPSSTSAINAKLDNNGTLAVTDGTLVLAGILSANAGVIDLQASSSALSTSSRDFVNSATGSIIGFGTLNLGGGTLTNNGNVNPGDASGAGVLNIAGNYVQGSGGTLTIDAASSSLSDKLQVSGTAALAGTLNVGETGGYTIGYGDGYVAVTAASVGGTFTVISGPMGVTLTPVYGASSVSLYTAGGPVNSWIGTDGDWSNSANWSLGRIPATGDVVIIDPSGVRTITLASAAAGGLFSLDFSAIGNDDIFLFSTGGTLSLPAAATLGGTLHIAGGTLTSASGPQTANMLKLSSGRLANSDVFNVTNATLASGTVIGPGTLNVSGALDWTTGIFSGGTLNTSGTTTLANGTHVLSDALWTNTGTVTHSGGSFSLTDSIFSNQQVFINTEAGGDLFESTAGSNLVHNTGTFNWSQAGTRGSGLTPFNNDGVVNVNTGATANMQSGGSGAGFWVAANGATLKFSGGTRSVDTGSNIVGAGTMLVNGGIVYVDGSFGIASSGTVAMQGGELYLNTGTAVSFAHGVTLSSGATLDLANDTTFPSLVINGSEVTGSVNKTVSGLLTLNDGAVAGGTLTTSGGASLGGANQVLSDLVWLNPATIAHTSGTLHLNNDSTLVNQAGGVINETGNGGTHPAAVTVSSGANGFISNAGTINWNATGSRSISGDVGLDNTGTINVTGGTLNMAGTAGFGQSGKLVLGAGTTFQRNPGFNNTGYIAGTGTIDVAGGTVTNMGTLSPGGEGTVGTLRIAGNLNMSSGTLLADLAGTASFDLLAVSGNLVQGGTLVAGEQAPFIAGGDSFNVVTYGGTLTGTVPTLSAAIPDVTLTLGAGAGALTLTAASVTNRWIDFTSGDWSNGTNWTRGHTPNALEDVIVNPLGVQTVTVGSGVQAARSLQVQGDDTLSLTGGSLALGQLSTVASGAALLLSAGTLGGAGGLNVAGSFGWTGGTLTGAGAMSTAGPVSIAGGTHFLNNKALTIAAGTATYTGGSINVTGTGGTLAVASGATLNLAVSDSTSTDVAGDGTFDAKSGSTINMTAPAGSNSIYTNQVNFAGTLNLLNGSLDFDNPVYGSTIDISGTLNLANGTSIIGYNALGGTPTVVNFNPGAAINLASGSAALNVNSWGLNFNTPLTLPAGVSINHSGNTVTAGANVVVGGTYALSGGMLTGTGNVTLNNAFNWSGGTAGGTGVLATSGVSNLSNTVTLTGKTLDNSGSMQIGSGATLLLSSGAQLNNLAAGTLVVGNAGGQGIGAVSGGGSISNAGKFELNGSTIATGGGSFSNSGTLIASGKLDLGGTGSFSNAGLLRIAGAGSTGTLSVAGNASLGTGTLEVDLAGPASYDLLAVSGNLVQGGTLGVSENTVFIAGGDTFNVVTYGGTLTGTAPVVTDGIADVGFTLNAGSGALQLVAATVSNSWLNVSGNWATGSNWSRGHTPNSFEDAFINPLGTQLVTLSSGAQAPRSLQLVGDDTLSVTGGSLAIANASTVGSGASFVLSGGVLSGSGALDVAGSFNWNAGKITAGAVNVAGVLTIGNAAVKELTGTLSHSNASGLSSWIGGDNGAGGVIDIIGGGRLVNQAGAVLEIATGGQSNRVGAYGFSPVGFIDNYGTLDVTGGGMFAFSPSNWANQQHQLRNFATGVVNVTDSHLYMHNDASSPIAQLGTWNFTGSGGTALLNLYGNNTWGAGATINTSGATSLAINGPTQLYSAAAQSWATVSITGGSSLAVNQNFTVTDAMSWAGSVTGSGGAAITLGSGANTTITGTSSLGGANLVNGGTLNIGSGATLNAGQLVSNAGLVALGGGTLTASSGLANSGTVSGKGRLNTGGTVTNTGTITPGGAGTVGTLSISGNADLSGGTLDVDLASLSSYDLLAVSGSLVRGGTLNVSETTPFISAGDSFDVVTYGGTVSGSAPVVNSSISGVAMGTTTTAPTGGALRLAPTSVTNIWLTGSGDWGDGSKWSRGHAPTNGEAITVDPSSGAETVTVSSGASGLASLMLGTDDSFLLTGGNFVLPVASSIGGTLTLAGGTLTNSGAALSVSALNWDTGTIGGTGSIAGALSLSGTGSRVLTGSTVTSFGGVTLSGGDLQLDGGAFGWSSGTLTVAGGATLGINGGAIDARPLLNQGTVAIGSAASALTSLDGGGTQTGQFTIASGKTLNLGTGNVTLAAGAGISGGTWTIDAGQVSIAGTLDRGAGAATALGGGTLSVAGAFTTASLAVSGGLLNGAGDLTVTDSFSQGAGSLGTAFDEVRITQQSGDLTIAGVGAASVTLASLNGSILDGNAGATNITAGNVKLSASTGIDIDLNTPLLEASLGGAGTIDVSNTGALELTAITAASGSANFTVGGPLTQSGAVQVMGPVSISTGGAGVTLNHAGNQFDGTISLVGTGATSIVDTSGLSVTGSASSLALDAQDVSVGSLAVSGPLTIIASGQISQGAAISVTGLTSLSASTIVMPTASTYSGGVTFNAGGAVTLASSGALVLRGTANHAGGTLSLTAAGPVSQTSALTAVGAASVSAAGETVDFGSLANDFSSVSFNAASVLLNDINSVGISGSVTGNVAITAASGVNSAGSVNFGSLDITLTGTGSVSVVGSNVAGAASFATSGAGSYQDIIYSNNSATGSVGGSILASGTVTLAFKNAGLALPQIQAGTLFVGSGGALTQTGAISAASTELNAVGYDISLLSGANHMGTLVIKANNASITDAGTLNIDGDIAGALQISAAALSQTPANALRAGSATLSGTSGIAMIGANELGTLAALSGGAITVNDIGASLTLGDISTPASLAVQSGGAVLQSTGATLSSGSLDMLALSIGTPVQPLNFSAPVATLYGVDGGVHAQSAQAFTLAGLGATGDASVSSAQALSVVGEAFAGGSLSLAGQGLTVHGQVTAQGVSLNAGSGTLAIGGGLPGGVFGATSVALAGHDILVQGGAQPGYGAQVISDGSISVNAAGNFIIQGGSKAGTLAEVTSFGPLSVTVGGALDVIGGSGDGAYAKLDPAAQSLLSVNAQSVTLQGGTGAGAYAAIVSEGDITVVAPGGITMAAGIGPDADAVVVSYFGKVTLPNCNGCVKLTASPFGNGTAETGVLGGDDYLAILFDGFVDTNELIQARQTLYKVAETESEEERRRRTSADIVIEGEVCK
ncbi:MAG: filamentous hemagglutinin N-terminal domain-containing protein [Pseudomonadota bacterium]